MADLHFEQACPCGDSIKVSGWASEVKTQIHTWQVIHTRHANAIAKAIIEAKSRQHTTWPRPLTATFESIFPHTTTTETKS